MLDDDQLEKILIDWAPREIDKKIIVTRQVSLPKQLENDIVLVIQGVRRCGKSTLLRQMIEHYQLAPNLCFYCNFEDPRLLSVLDYQILEQITRLVRAKVPKEKSCYFFFDEIQNVHGWEKWLHVKLERPENNFYTVTGSNAALLGGEFSTALTGRHRSVELYPFSLTEFLDMFPSKGLDEYVREGGFPRVLRAHEPKALLQEYFRDIIYRDIVGRIPVRSNDAILQLVRMVMETCGSELSYRNIAAALGISVDTVKSYIMACESAYLLFACPYFAFSERKRELHQKKYYPIDPGLRSAVSTIQGQDKGKALELLTFLHLKKHYDKVYYWQEPHKGKIDFVVIHQGRPVPYQVTWGDIHERHYRAIENFMSHFPMSAAPVFVTAENATDFLKNPICLD